MKNSYKVVVKTNQGNAKTVTHDVPAPGSWWGALKIKAVPGARYQLIDNTTGQGPDNIRVKRTGNDLRISFDGREDADLVISDYYEYTEPGFAALIGEADPGVFHAYLPESGQTSALVGNLPDGASNVGMALGGEQVGASGAAVGALVAVAGFNPLLAAPLALLGAGGGGGGGADGASGTGGGGVPDTTPPVISAARLAPEDDTGVSNSDGITADKTPKLLITADPDAVSATVTLMNGKIYTSTTKNAQGQFVVQVDTMPDGKHPFSVQVKDAAGNQSPPFEGAFTVDTSASDNYSSGVAKDLNQGVKVSIDAIDADTGFSASDFITQDSTLTFKGSLDAFTNNGAHVQVFLYDEKNVLMATHYTGPAIAAPYPWRWDFGASQSLSDGRYSLEAQLTDLAGNVLSTKVKQSIVISTQADPAGFAVGLSKLTLLPEKDSGKFNTDFLTNQKELVFTGQLTGFSKAHHKLFMEVVNADGQLVSSAFVEPDSDGRWRYENSWGVDKETVRYVIKSSVVDLAGNIFKSTSQSFVVDRDSPEMVVSGGQDNVFEKITFKASEAGTFFSGPASFDNGLTLVANEFDKGDFSLSFEDLAGNVTTLVNGDKWQIKDKTPVLEVGPSPAGFVTLAGPVGSYQLGADQNALDLSSLDSLVPRVGDRVAINHVSMRDKSGDDVLTISMGDVLSLGVANSFTNTGSRHLQMRIDGDVGDRVLLDSFVGSSKALLWSTPLEQSLGSDKYAVYSNAALGLDLFIQQGIVTTVL